MNDYEIDMYGNAGIDLAGYTRRHTKKGRMVFGLRLKSEFASAADEDGQIPW